MRLKDGFILRDVCGQTVIIAEGLGVVNFDKLLVLNETAAWMWKKAREQGAFTIDSLATCLCQEYDVSDEVAKSDVADIVAKWQEIGLIE